MLPFRKIIFPIDYSEPCKAAAAYVKEMTQRFDAQLTLVHAYGAEALAYSQLSLIDPRLLGEAKAGAEQQLKEFALSIFPSLHVEMIVSLGEPASAIQHAVQHQQADLIMLPTWGRGPIRRMLLGSVTAKLLHDLSGAIWTATPAALEKPSHGYKSILCACSLQDRADTEAVLRAGAALAHIYNAALSIIHIFEPVPITTAIDYVALRREVQEAAQVQLRELKASLGIDASHRITEGFVGTSIQSEANRTHAELIVVGRGHNQGTVSRLWSHLYSVVRDAPCPVLSV